MKIENEFIQFNSMSAEQLFEIYHSLNFIYPVKKETLHPMIHTERGNREIAYKLLFRASEIHALSPLKYIPALTDLGYSVLLEELNGKITRNYNLFIMLKGAYERYYEEVDELTNSISQRFTNKSYERS